MKLRTRDAGKLSFLLATALVAGPAQARRHRPPRPAGPPPARAEDDPRKRGNDKVFAKATISFTAPAELAQLDQAQPVRIGLHVSGYALGALQPGGPAPHLHLIVDNEPAVEIKSLAQPLRLTGLARGPHLLRAVLCRPWHEVVKARHAFAMVRFWVGPRLAGKAGKAAEYVAWPDPKKPVLTYVLPVGPPSKAFEVVNEVQQQPDASDPERGVPLPAPTPGADKPVLDFYLANGRLGRRGDKVRIVLDRRELPLMTEWKPQHLRRARGGAHKLTIDLLNRRGLKVKNGFNRTDRVFTAGDR
jgi:hypothetical protein